jgi:hypothetical protein
MESVAELIEKLIIANIKLWMVKDAETAIACRDLPVLEEVREHLASLTRTETLAGGEGYSIDAMHTLLSRLEELCKLHSDGLLPVLRQLVVKDIELCEARAAYRRDINEKLRDHTASDAVKKYGHRE